VAEAARRCGGPCGVAASSRRSRAPRSRLQPDVRVGPGVGEARNGAEAGFLAARAHAVEERQLPDRRVDHALVDELLDPVQHRLAPLVIELCRLLAEQAVDVGVAAVDVGAARGDERLQPRGGVTEGAAGALDDVLELLLAVPAEECRALERAELGRAPTACR